MEINKLLDQCKEKLEAKTDYQLWKKTGIPQTRISDYRGGKREPDEFACLKIAEILELDPVLVIAHFAARKAKNSDQKSYLQKYIERLGGMAAAILMCVTFIVTPTPSEAAPVLKGEVTTVYIMLNVRRVIKRIKKTALSLVSQISGFCVSVAQVRQMPA